MNANDLDPPSLRFGENKPIRVHSWLLDSRWLRLRCAVLFCGYCLLDCAVATQIPIFAGFRLVT
jgi:hypothetical protein